LAKDGKFQKIKFANFSNQIKTGPDLSHETN